MKDESRTMWVVLLVCGFVMCGCIVLPLGLGAAFFMGISRQQAVLAEQSRAEAARVQAEMAKTRAELEQLKPPAPPPAAAPPSLPPGLGTVDVTDLTQRKLIYQTLKTQREVAVQLEHTLAQLASVSDDPALKQAPDIKKLEQQMLDEIAKQWKVTRQQLDEIVAEGDKAGW